MAKPTSLQDVAGLAGLSPATVSRYLNGSLSLPHETASRIDKAIAELSYRPNPHARSLSRGKSEMIGLVIPDIANPFFARLAASVEKYANAAGYGLMLCSSINHPARELDYVERLRRNFVDGLLFSTNHVVDERLAAAIDAGSNIVLLDENVTGVNAPKVFSDNVEGGRMAARHLIERGHRRFGFVGGPERITTTSERLQGYRSAIAEASNGAELSVSLFGQYTGAYGREAAISLLDRLDQFTALFVASDEILLGMLEIFRERRIRLGRDISLVAFDDAGPLTFFDPPVTAIRQSIDMIGQIAVSTLLDGLRGREDNTIHRVPVELIERGSVAVIA